MDDEIPWHYVAADYKAVHVGSGRKRHLWERRVFVFRATADKAEETALRIAKENEHEYVSATGDLVRWTFQRIESTSELLDREISEGTEVYWDWCVRVDQTKTKSPNAKNLKDRKVPRVKS